MRWPWRKAETELSLEVQHHLEMLADSYEQQGMTRKEAMQRARREFGGVDQFKEQCRDIRWWNWLANISQDMRFGWRMMRKTPAITLAAVVSLALGIGATTTILSLADALLWRTLAVPAPEQLLEVFWESKAHPDDLIRGSSGSLFRESGMIVADFFSMPSFSAMQMLAAGKAEVAGHINSPPVSTSFRGKVTVARVRAVTGNFWSTLQLHPFTGRLFTDRDDAPASAPVVVVTHAFWRRHLGSDQGVGGQAIRVNNVSYEIAGVLPASFVGIVPGDETDLYVPLRQSPVFLEPDSWYRSRSTDPKAWLVQLIVRRAHGVTEDTLRSLLDAAFASSWVAQPKSAEATPRIRLSHASRGLGSIRRQFGNPIWILLGLVTLVLLVACANIANLLLARAANREKEIALRVSLGCSEGRLIRQFLTESLLLATIGGALSIVVAVMLGKLMLSLMPYGIGPLSIEPSARSLAGTAIVTLITALLFGLYPAWRATRIDAAPALKEGSGSAGTVSRMRWTPAKMLVIAQVSPGVLLVMSAILFTSHLNEMVSRETGFERGHILLFDVRPGEVGYQGDRLRQFYYSLEEHLSSLPGVAAVGLARTRPMRGGGYWDRLQVPGNTKGAQSAVHHCNPAFLAALGVPIAAGRGITDQEVRSGAKVAVISEDLARELALTSPLGARVLTERQQYEVIGVARRARYSDMVEAPPVIYLPIDYGQTSATVVVRTSIPPMAVLGAIRNEMREMDRSLPIVDIYTMEQQISLTLRRERLFAWLCGSFGVLALVLCVVGLYGLMSHTTARRTPEIGIRMALGASRGDVIAQVLWEGVRLAAIGLVLGVPLALYGAHIAGTQKMLPQGPLPYWTLAAAIGVLAVSAVAAVLAPAVRAASVDPMQALRRG